MHVRFFWSSMDPADVSELRRIFLEDVKPVFAALSGCSAVELAVCADTNAGGLLEGAIVSRWDSLDQLGQGLESRGVAESLVKLLPLLRLEPVIQTFQILG